MFKLESNTIFKKGDILRATREKSGITIGDKSVNCCIPCNSIMRVIENEPSSDILTVIDASGTICATSPENLRKDYTPKRLINFFDNKRSLASTLLLFNILLVLITFVLSTILLFKWSVWFLAMFALCIVAVITAESIPSPIEFKTYDEYKILAGNAYKNTGKCDTKEEYKGESI